jgi:hypothetical protein
LDYAAVRLRIEMPSRCEHRAAVVELIPMSDLDRTKVTFEQAEGLAPLPSQLKPKELSAALRSGLWFVIHGHLTGATRHVDWGPNVVIEPWRTMLRDMHIFRNHLPADEFSANAQEAIAATKKIFMNGAYADVYGWLQYVLRHGACPRQVSKDVQAALKFGKAGYRLTPDGKTFMPIASTEEAEVASKAFAALNATEYAGARKHLTTAAERLTAGDSPGAVRESIHSVESVARVITNEKTFGAALAALEKRWNIHNALKRGFGAIYGYTSDEDGIRHPLLDDPNASVDEIDAVFMFGACAAFISYLIQKAKSQASAEPKARIP